MKRLLFVFLLILPAMSFASVTTDDIRSNYNNLSEEQRLQIAMQINKLKKENSAPSIAVPDVATVDNMQKWVDLGSSLGKGFAASAKELGIAVNEFASTGVGKFTMFIIAWTYIGETLLETIYAMLWFGIGIPIWYFMLYKRITFEFNKVVELKKRHFWGTEYTEEEAVYTRDDDGMITSIVVLAIVCIVGFVIAA